MPGRQAKEFFENRYRIQILLINEIEKNNTPRQRLGSRGLQHGRKCHAQYHLCVPGPVPGLVPCILG